MALIEVERAAALLVRAWAGSPPAEAGGRERCRQLIGRLRHHDPALVAQAERPGAVPDAARIEQALAEAARHDPSVRTLLGQLAAIAPPRAAAVDQQVRIDGNNNRVVNAGTLQVLSEMGLDFSRDLKPCILFLAANPTDTTPLRSGEEQREIRDALALTGDRYQLESRQAVRPRDLSLALMQLRPQIIHYSGHGDASGALCLENDQGETHPVTPPALAEVFSALAGTIECVVLNACFSSLQAEEISRHVKYVVGMTHEVGDQAAVAFATGFYQAVGAGASIPEAVAMGRGLFAMQNLPDHHLPVMMTNGALVA